MQSHFVVFADVPSHNMRVKALVPGIINNTYTHMTHAHTHTHTHTIQCDVGSPCFPGVVCVDYDDGYSCGECPDGYTGSTVRGYDLHDATELQQVCLCV